MRIGGDCAIVADFFLPAGWIELFLVVLYGDSAGGARPSPAAGERNSIVRWSSSAITPRMNRFPRAVSSRPWSAPRRSDSTAPCARTISLRGASPRANRATHGRGSERRWPRPRSRSESSPRPVSGTTRSSARRPSPRSRRCSPGDSGPRWAAARPSTSTSQATSGRRSSSATLGWKHPSRSSAICSRVARSRAAV